MVARSRDCGGCHVAVALLSFVVVVLVDVVGVVGVVVVVVVVVACVCVCVSVCVCVCVWCTAQKRGRVVSAEVAPMSPRWLVQCDVADFLKMTI